TTATSPLSLHDALPILTGTSLSTAATATATIAMTTLQKAIIAVALTATVGTGIYEARQTSSFRSQVQRIQEQQSENIQQLERERSEEHTSELQSRFDLV